MSKTGNMRAVSGENVVPRHSAAALCVLLAALACAEPAAPDADEPARVVTMPPPAPGGAGLAAQRIGSTSPAPGVGSRHAERRRSPVRAGGDELGYGVLDGSLETAFERAHTELDLQCSEGRHDPLLHDLRARRLEVVLTSRPLTHRERRHDLESHPVVHVAMAAIVHPRNRLVTISKGSLADILAGELRSWHGLTGLHETVELVALEEVDRLQRTAMLRLFPGRALRAGLRERTIGGVVARVARSPAAIALVPLGAARTSAVRALSIDGVRLSDLGVRSRKYPLAWTLHLVTRKQPSAAVARFIGFATAGVAARALRKIGVSPP